MDISHVFALLHCKVGNFPFAYLGLPHKPTSLSKADWQPLLDRINERLTTWKVHTLSRGGKLVLN